jgi:cell division protease FtsH
MLLDEQYAVAKHLLENNRDKVEAMVSALLEWETIDADQVNDIMSGNPPRAPKVSDPVNPSSGSDGSTPTPAQGNSPATV